jgi:hypothetical protein
MFVSIRMSCVVNRVGGMIPEVVSLRGVDDYTSIRCVDREML